MARIESPTATTWRVGAAVPDDAVGGVGVGLGDGSGLGNADGLGLAEGENDVAGLGDVTAAAADAGALVCVAPEQPATSDSVEAMATSRSRRIVPAS